jgi:cell wall-associated NlpC family hydrolase
MLPEAKPCVRTWDKSNASDEIKQSKPRLRGALSYSQVMVSLIKQLFVSILFVAVTLMAAGCSSSSPRFKGNEKKSPSPAPVKHGPRFSSKEVEEEIKENDKKPDAKEVESIAKGTRDFRKEKNSALAPLDQSKMMREISKYMGVPYVLGGSTLDGMDCSGYTSTVYKNSINKPLPRTSSEQSKLGIHVGLQDLKFGDLIFFNTTGESTSHVGIYLGDDLFAHASVSLGVTISSLQSSYYAKRYETARRIVD